MRKVILSFLALTAIAGGAHAALINSDFSNFGSNWNPYSVNSGSVTFDGSVATINAIGPTNGAGLYQEDLDFTTLGQEFSVTTTVNNTGNIRMGFLNAALETGPNNVYANGETGPKTVVCDDPAFNHAFAEKTGAVGGIIAIDSIVTNEITAPPTWGSGTGASSVSRQSDTSATLNWNQAEDNVTPMGQIVYNIYWSEVEGDVFTEGIKDTVVGALTTTVTGLPSNGAAYFGVRAVDRVGNGESNAVTVSLAPVLSVDHWNQYE